MIAFLKKEITNITGRFFIFGEFWYFLKENKAWWLVPMLLTLGMLGILIIFASTSAFAPFIYTLF